MRERGISRDLVEKCISFPDKLISEDTVNKAVKRINRKVLIVIYREESVDL